MLTPDQINNIRPDLLVEILRGYVPSEQQRREPRL